MPTQHHFQEWNPNKFKRKTNIIKLEKMLLEARRTIKTKLQRYKTTKDMGELNI